MDKTALKRHAFIEITLQGRKWAFDQLTGNDQGHEQKAIYQLVVEGFNAVQVPGIIRREESPYEDVISVGFAAPYLTDGRRLRLAAYVPAQEVSSVSTPYDVLAKNFEPHSALFRVLRLIRDFGEKTGIKIGVLGSVGLEIYTGLPYTHSRSDIDILVKETGFALITECLPVLKKIGDQYGISIDAEVELSNGYGVKADELFMDTDTILGKGIKDVVLLERRQVMALFAKHC